MEIIISYFIQRNQAAFAWGGEFCLQMQQCGGEAVPGNGSVRCHVWGEVSALIRNDAELRAERITGGNHSDDHEASSLIKRL